jgi:hypothetical protein
MRSQKGHSIALITVQTQPNPYQMNMVRHQAIGWAEQTFTHSRMQHQLPKTAVE